MPIYTFRGFFINSLKFKS